MPRKKLLERIRTDPVRCGGKPCIRGHCIRVSSVLGMLANGATHGEIQQNHPGLTEEDILACVAYASETARERHVELPHRISTLLYCFSENDEVLLLERAQEPNLGFWSPCGGKLDTTAGESPYACARREALEEIGLVLKPRDLHLTGIVSEHGYLGQAHWLMFLFEVRPRLTKLPPAIREGRFAFYPRSALRRIPIPQTDRERIWPWFWRHRGGFFAAHCHTHSDGRNEWLLEESITHEPWKISHRPAK